MSTASHRRPRMRSSTAHLPFCIGDQGGSAVIGIEGLEHAKARVADIAQGGAQKQERDQNNQNGESDAMHVVAPSPSPAP